MVKSFNNGSYSFDRQVGVDIPLAAETPGLVPAVKAGEAGGGWAKDSARGARQEWTKGFEFVLACVGNAVGLGNVWRFPYLAYSSGGGAFLVPYFIMLILCGIPLLYMEIGVGQSTQRGPVGALQKLCPFFQGAGMATVMLSFLLSTYYNVILTWAIYYLFNTFAAVLPWATCTNEWNTKQCFNNYTDVNTTRPNNSVSPSQEFYERQVLRQTTGIHDQGSIRWELLLILFGAWVLVYLCLCKGVKITGKIVYFTATFPYFIIVTLLVRGLTLPGAHIGVDFFINPKWELLLLPTVWVNAAAQNFNSIGIAFGSMIALSSYNKRQNKILKDVLIICSLNSATSILAGFAIFSILGNIAFNQGRNITEVVTEGPGLVFIVYPEAFTSMPYPFGQLLAGLFFFMLLCLAIDSQFANVEVVVTTLQDHLAKRIKPYLRHEILVLIVCIVAFLLAIPNVMEGGIYFFKLIDFYSSSVSLMLVAIFEVISIAWFYGAKRLAKDLELMTGSRPYVFFIGCWYFCSPALILTIMVFSWTQYQPVTYGKYIFPPWAIGLGWALAGLSLVCIPLGMLKAILEARGDSFCKKIRNSLRARADSQTMYNEVMLDKVHKANGIFL